MKRPPPSRSEGNARRRERGARNASSVASVGERDGAVRGRAQASRAADAGAVRSQRGARRSAWSQGRVIEALRSLARSGQSTQWADLMQAGRGDLVRAAATHAGGLRRARALARLRPPARRPVRRWSKAAILAAIEDRRRDGQPLASSRAPQQVVAAARWHFGSWDAALAAAGVDAGSVRLRREPYGKREIIELLRRLGRDGTALRPSTLKRAVKLDAIRRLFGSVERAVRAAGLVYGPHPNQTWSRERVIDELRARARDGDRALTPALHRAARRHFGGAEAARAAAGLPAVRAVWTRASLIEELRRRARQGDGGRTLWAAGRRLFGSMAAARRAAGVPATQRTKGMAAWDRQQLLAELRRRARQRRQLSRGLVAGLRRQFGSLTAARQRAGLARKTSTVAGAPRGARRRWSRQQVIDKLRRWRASGERRLPRDLALACKLRFGSVARARAAASLPARATPWTADRIRQALRERGFDATDPAFVAACIHHFGSVTAARAASRGRQRRTWSKATVIAELQARSRRGLAGVGRLLRGPAVRLFGSTDAALRAAQTSS